VRLLPLLALGLRLLVACGGSPTSPAATCGKVSPCGGDVVGDWTIVASCQTGIQFDFAFCPQYTIDASGLATTGTFSLKEDQSYTVATTAGGSFEVDFPSSCVAAGTTCADLTPAVQTVLEQMLGPALQSVTCAGDAACACTVLPVPSDNNGSGTYVLSGTAFIATPADGTPLVSYDYCSQRNTLHLETLDPTMSTGPGGQPAIVYDIVAERP
jgi:hypothetical protein